MTDKYTKAKDYLGKTVSVKVDRPLGSKHPKHEIYYGVNYGFVPETLSPDGKELDAYILGVFVPVTEFTGKCIAFVHRTNDNDDKLVIAPEERNFSEEEIKALVEFQERFFESVILR
jgi:inorganic pyrophosphatase